MKYFYAIVILLVCSSMYASENPSPQQQALLGNTRSLFEENKGQVTGADASLVKYVLKDGNLSMFLLGNGIAYQFNRTHYPEGYKHVDKTATPDERQKMDELQKNIRIETYRMDVQLVGANTNAAISTEGESDDYIQYYNHNALDVHSYSKITYHNIYPNIDWVIYKKGESVEYDFVVHPGGNPKQIKIETKWVENLQLNENGSLTMKNRMGEVKENTPVSFQNEKVIATTFKVEGNYVSFDVPNYNPNETLIIDPLVRIWATYYGGNSDDYGTSCAVDGAGYIYLAGTTYSASSIASGGYQNTIGGGDCDAFLVKFNASGVRQWATYYGGSSNDYCSSCTVGGSGNIYIAGYTYSNTSIAFGGHQNTIGSGGDAFIVKFNSAGIRQWATYYGGNSYDYGYSCAVDGTGNVYLAGVTSSNTAIASGGHQNTFGGVNYDAFVVKFNSAGVRQWGTYYGGNGSDHGLSCSVDGAENIYLAGKTYSTTSIASGGHQNAIGGGDGDAFLVKFNSAGVRQWSTYYGGSYGESGRSCTVDDDDNVYLTGFTYSPTSIAFGGHQNTGGFGDAFLVKFNSAGVRLWGTYYGGNGEEWGNSCAVDATGNVYLAGQTYSNTSIASGGHQDTLGGIEDAFLVKFDSAGVRQWGTYYGGSGADYGNGCTVDVDGNIYLSGETGSNSSIASGGHQNTNGGGFNDAFLTKFSDVTNCIPSNSSLTELACGSYVFNSQTLSQSGTYNDTLQNAAGCDSIITLTLTISQPTSSTLAQSACDSYVFNGVTLTQSGIYKDSLTNTSGCDSIVTLNLTINQATSSTLSQSACGSFVFNNQTLTQNGTYKDTLQNIAGCDSIVTLNLTINQSTVSTQTISACGSYVFNNQTLTQNGTYKDTLQNAAGCDSIVTLNLTINLNPIPTVNAAGYNLTTQSYAGYQWQLNGNNIAGATAQNHTATANGSYSVAVSDANGCRGTSTAVNITGVGINSIHPNDLSFTIHPNPATSVLHIHCNAQGYTQTKVLSASGQQVSAFQFLNTMNLNIEDYAQGVYIIQFIDENGNSVIQRFLKE